MPREQNIVDAIRRDARARGAFVVKLHGGPAQRAGLPDLIIIIDGLTIWCECKRPGQHPTPIQAATADEIGRAGGIAIVVHSATEARNAIDAALEARG